MSPIYAVECQFCGAEDEIITTVDNRQTTCRRCNRGQTVRVPAVHGPNCVNDDSPWIRTVLEVVDKEAKTPHVVNFLKDPTRANYKAWMKGEGIRPLENGEKHEKFKLDVDRHASLVMKEKIRRERLEVRG